MARGPENTFIAAVHRHLPPSLYWMKNHNQYNAGIADCWYSGNKRDLWVEYKFIEIPKTQSTAIKLPLSKLQQLWLQGRFAEGRSVWVIAGSREGGVIYSTQESWAQPITPPLFRTAILNHKSIAARIFSFVEE